VMKCAFFARCNWEFRTDKKTEKVVKPAPDKVSGLFKYVLPAIYKFLNFLKKSILEQVEINFQESFALNFTRIAGLYNRQALKQLMAPPRDYENIHQARLCFKRLRSMIRMGRYGIDENEYDRLNVFYRDRGRALSELRDLTVISETLKSIIKTRDSKEEREFLIRFRARIIDKRRKDQGKAVLDDARQEVIHRLSKMQGQISDWKVEKEKPDIFLLGLKNTFSEARKQYKNLRSGFSDHQLHDWRKQVKYFWYQLELISGLWPPLLKVWIKELKTLAQGLGRHHDLVLLETALKEYTEPELEDLIGTTLTQIGEEKANIEQSALLLGAKIFAVRPACVYQQLKACVSE
jgi:CHAD domain-containing protein